MMRVACSGCASWVDRFQINVVEVEKQAGFRGIYSIEYGGPDPYGGVQQIIDLVLQFL